MLLTPREKSFVSAYLGRSRGNATKAAIAAGYSRKTARQTGHRLLTKADIRQAVDQVVAAREKKTIAAAEERDLILSAIARDTGAENGDRIRSVIELNRCSGRHSLHLIHKGKLTVAEALGLSRSPELDAPPDDDPTAPDPGPA